VLVRDIITAVAMSRQAIDFNTNIVVMVCIDTSEHDFGRELAKCLISGM